MCAVGDDGGDEVAQQGGLAGSRRTVHADDAAIPRLLSRQIDRRLLQQDQRMASSAGPAHGRVEMRGDGAAERGSAVQEVSLLGRRDHSQVLPQRLGSLALSHQGSGRFEVAQEEAVDQQRGGRFGALEAHIAADRERRRADQIGRQAERADEIAIGARQHF